MKNTVIHCKTQKQFNKVLEIFEEKGWIWNGGYKPLKLKNNWKVYKEETFLNYFDMFCYGKVPYHENKTNYKIISFKEFMKLEGKYKKYVQIINKSKHELPNYSTKHSAGIDLKANIEKPIILKPLQRILVPTGLFIQLPEGHEAQIRPRSGLAINFGITILNSPGTIDSDYRGEIMVILINFSNKDFVINDGERICQMVITKYTKIEFEEVEILKDTERGNGGFGHTGIS